jgi:hypothetical protein
MHGREIFFAAVSIPEPFVRCVDRAAGGDMVFLRGRMEIER